MTSGMPLARNPLGAVRPSSARALLLVLIGEFVWPAGQRARSSALLAALSEFGIEPNAGQVNYAAAKAGIVGLTRVMNLELLR